MSLEHDPLNPVSTRPYLGNGDQTTPWAVAVEELTRAGTYWLATVHPAGRPHVVPVLAVWADSALCFAAGPGTRKVKNLVQNPAAIMTAHGDRLDLVVEGTAVRVTDHKRLARIADEYAAKYGWPVDVRNGALPGEGAPTAGPSPYHAYKLDSRQVFGFPTDDREPPTRWLFS